MNLENVENPYGETSLLDLNNPTTQAQVARELFKRHHPEQVVEDSAMRNVVMREWIDGGHALKLSNLREKTVEIHDLQELINLLEGGSDTVH